MRNSEHSPVRRDKVKVILCEEKRLLRLNFETRYESNFVCPTKVLL